MTFGAAGELEEELPALRNGGGGGCSGLGGFPAGGGGIGFISLEPDSIRFALKERGYDPDADRCKLLARAQANFEEARRRENYTQMRNAAGMLSPYNSAEYIRGASHTYTEGHRNALAQVGDALTPRAGEYRPLTRFQRFRVRLYAPLFRLARRRGVISF